MSHCKDCRFFQANSPKSGVEWGFCLKPDDDDTLFFPHSMEEAHMCVFPNFGCVQFEKSDKV